MLALVWAIGAPAGVAEEPRAGRPRTEAAPLDIHTAELLRCYLLDAPLPSLEPSRVQASPSARTVDQWRRFMEIQRFPESQPDTVRERALHSLYGESESPLLRSRILETIAGDPRFQSRQAEFIRQYGFYANGINRVFYSLGRIVQGKLEAIVQLGVDAVFGLTASGRADARTRVAYQKYAAALAGAPSVTETEREKLATLKGEVDRALGEEDMERARWALKTEHPEAAAFYARQAELILPEKTKARKLRERAEADAARALREGVASRQVGYPDRTPPIRLTDPELLRGVLLDEIARLDLVASDDRMLAEALRALERGDEGDGPEGQATRLRAWAPLMERYPTAPEEQREWAAATMGGAIGNPDMRLAQARQRRRGQLTRYIFLGPETPRRQAYKTASWGAQSLQAMQNVGLFYVFEVVARAVSSLWKPPIPEAESLDARAAWLRQAPPLPDAERRAVAASLARDYRAGGRYEDTREVLGSVGALTEKEAKALDRAEARRLARWAEKTASPEERQALIDRIRDLDPEIADDVKIREARVTPRQWRLGWDVVQRWAGEPLPCGLPGSPAWFDGRVENGEASPEGLFLEEPRTAGGPLRVEYRVTLPGEVRLFEGTADWETLPTALKGWLEVTHRQDRAAQDTIRRLHRLPFPFALEGDAGASGVDVSPKLLPIEDPSAPLELYR
jgi:hypothetical protein